ncbi:MAG: hypothetical protein ACRD0Z_06280 [Acidimicrobiales bacterium]
MTSPFYDIVFVAHVVVAFVGFGAIGMAGLAASRGRHLVAPEGDANTRRFFKPGTDWPARLIFLVPVLGLVLLFGSDRTATHGFWPWMGLAIWVVAGAAATGWCWPAERRAQKALEEERIDDFRRACYQIETAVGLISICFVFALLVMIVQP